MPRRRHLKAGGLRVDGISVDIGRRDLIGAAARMNLQSDFDVLIGVVGDIVSGGEISGSEIHLPRMRGIRGIRVQSAEAVHETIVPSPTFVFAVSIVLAIVLAVVIVVVVVVMIAIIIMLVRHAYVLPEC